MVVLENSCSKMSTDEALPYLPDSCRKLDKRAERNTPNDVPTQEFIIELISLIWSIFKKL